MIRTEAEFQEALRRRDQDRQLAELQRQELVKRGLTPEAVDRAMEPLLSFQAQLEEEIEWYENARAGNALTINRLTQIGRLLIALRIASGITQRELAKRLGVTEAVVSRDERNEYHGISIERVQRIVDALQASVTTQGAPKQQDLVLCQP
ncbi:MAG: helix-turn-helix domain-containing protein [Chloroflexi bacterium]|nr:helix-turn-helix domain-containing protein [Chloroflexota bacterium]